MRREHIVLDEQKIPFLYGSDCVDDVVAAIGDVAGPARSAVFVVDRKVSENADAVQARLSRRLAVHRFTVDSAEAQKRLTLVEALLGYAVESGADRNSLLIAMGGGLVGNVAGLAAALLYRGIRLVHLPTTPVAAFDAVLSQKQAVNLAHGKNLCGSYLPPSLIACDLTWLASIPRHDLLTGIAEMAKNVLAVVPQREDVFTAAVADLDRRPIDAFTALCELGIDAKVPLLAKDPRERREALIFEYGHTVGHALEIVTGGGLSHGAAITWGMCVAAEVSAALGFMDEAEVDHHYRLLAQLRLPPASEVLAPVDRTALLTALRRDNKRGHLRCGPDEIAMVLLSAPGVPVARAGRPLHAVPEHQVMAAFERVARGRVRSDG
jgi:3-dehydroquinate synthase/2-deoxy-scyllo-inosose synthase